MFVEAHSSVLKRLNLLPYNQPRVELQIYIIGTKLMPKFKNDFIALKNGQRKPAWLK